MWKSVHFFVSMEGMYYFCIIDIVYNYEDRFVVRYARMAG